MSIIDKVAKLLPQKNQAPLNIDEKVTIGPDLSFAASEAYKLLRTNIIFSLPNDEECRVIGVTSSVRGEGKSTISLNLAYALAEAGKRVLLMELDMRLPTVAKRLNIAAKPGLSNLLVGLNKASDVLQHSGVHSNFYAITSGDIPPNPSELLGSDEMKTTIELMKKNFDFVILDLPPINAVSDALIISKLTNGMVMVVRQDYNGKAELNEAMRQLKIADAKVLGFVVNAGESHEDKYGGKRYRGRGYGDGYGERPKKK